MENYNRRLAIKQMLLFTAGSGLAFTSCDTPPSGRSNKQVKPLEVVHVPINGISKAKDGTYVGLPKIRSEHTNGQFCCHEIAVPARHAGPPPHLHKELDEIMYVIEGTVQVMVGETVTDIHAGEYHLRPHGIAHTFWNASDLPTRFIDMYPNQDFPSFFEEMVRIKNRLKSKGLSHDSEEGINSLDKLYDQFGVEMFPEQFPAIIEKYDLTVVWGHDRS